MAALLSPRRTSGHFRLSSELTSLISDVFWNKFIELLKSAVELRHGALRLCKAFGNVDVCAASHPPSEGTACLMIHVAFPVLCEGFNVLSILS